MPFVIIEGYRFGFYSLDQDEPPHVHVYRERKRAKVWLDPVEPEWNRGYNEREMNRVLKLTREHQQELLEMWHEHFSK